MGQGWAISCDCAWRPFSGFACCLAIGALLLFVLVFNSQDEVMDGGRKSADIVYSFMHENGVNKTIVRQSAGKRWSNP